MSVKKEKYDKAKHAVHAWHDKYEECKNERDALAQQLSELPNNDLVDEYEAELSHLKKQIRSLKKELQNSTKKYTERITALEREKILYEGKIQQLEDGKTDLRERYHELKEDYRELLRTRNNRSIE